MELTVIVPTMNEAGNVQPLVERLAAVLTHEAAEVLFVDDSRDETPQVISALAQKSPLPVRLLHRPLEARNGLSGAVVDGLQAARGRWVCVMDGDLQHPPEVVPQLLAAAQKLDADMVVASRKANVLGPQGLTLFRTLTSQSLTILARAMFPRSLKDVSDPLTGFFLVRRDQVDATRLQPEGFKILLEILVRCPDMRITEVHFDFAERYDGESKADFQEGMRFFRHLMTLRLTAHQRPMGKYLLVGLLTFLLNNGLVWLLAGPAVLHPLLAVALATELSDLMSFWGNRRFVFPNDGIGQKFGRYVLVNQLFLLFLRLPLFALSFFVLGWPLLISNILAIALTTGVRYLLSDRWIWTRDLLAHERAINYYDIYGLLTIESPIPLPDMIYFQTDREPAEIDIRLRLDRHGTPRRTRDTISYDEGLGRLGFAVTIYPLERFAEVVASPLVQRSPTVLYSNVIEPLLRWMLWERNILLVQAGILMDGERGAILVSDQDPQRMLIKAQALADESADITGIDNLQSLISADGMIYPFPKPSTTGQVLNQDWIRRFGARLRRLGLPVATVYTVAQWLIPPRREKLILRAEHQKRGRLLKIDAGHSLGVEAAAAQLLANGRDPYGFPLLSLLADRSGVNFDEKEFEVMNSAISHLKN